MKRLKQHPMVALARRVFECGGDVAVLQLRVVGKDFPTRRARGEQSKHILLTRTRSPHRQGRSLHGRVIRFSVP
jgi:hypothetical protein